MATRLALVHGAGDAYEMWRLSADGRQADRGNPADWEAALGELPTLPAPVGVAGDRPRFAAPCRNGAKVICVGHNYRAHVREVGAEFPTYPTLFTKFPDSLIGARDPIPAGSCLDWEAELVCVVGATLRRADVAVAEAAIAGFTAGNDITVRDWQRRTTQWLAGKAWEASTPVGPFVVPVAELGAAPDLEITCTVNGIEVQRSRTSDMIFPPAEILSYISQFTTLRPGDLVFTGTPAGVGMSRSPQQWLQRGDEVVTVIESIGELRNVVA